MTYSGPMDAVLAERDKLRAEVERLRATDKEAKSAFAPWVQGPGIVGGILHLQEEVERLRADANARAVEELRKLHHRSWYGVVDLDREIDKRIVELSKPAAKESEPVRCIASLGDNHCEKGRGHAGLHCCRNVEWIDEVKESEQQHGQESTATAAPSRSPQGEGVEVPPRGQEQGASRPRGIGQPAHPPGARGGESGIVAESQGHRSGETFLACVTMTVVLVLAMCLGYVHPLKWVAADWFALGIMLWICSRWIYLESKAVRK